MKSFPLISKIFLLSISLAIIYTVFLIFSSSKIQPPLKTITLIPTPTPIPTQIQTPVNTDYLSYQNNLLGLKFEYPKKLGKIRTIPEIITHLDRLHLDRDDFAGSHDRITLEFSEYFSPSINIYLFSDKHQGEIPPYAEFANSTNQFLDNFNVLKTSGNICNYHLNFNYSKAVHQEIVFSCDPETNTSQSLIEIKQIFENGKTYYQYQLKRYFYKKLNNKFYDHLLVSESDTIVQSENNPAISDISDIYNYLPQSDLEQKYTQFKKLVGSINSIPVQSYSPQKHPKISDSDPDINTIYRYYSYLEQGQLQSAYRMYQKPTVSFSDYQSWYKNTVYTDITNIQKQNNGFYQIDIDLQDRNQPIETYRVTMSVNSGKISTTSSIRLIEEKKFNQNLSARIELIDQVQKLIIRQNNQDNILGTCQNYPKSTEKFAENCYFSRLNFTPDGSHLYVNFGAWEYGSKKVYNLLTKKEVIEAPSANFFEITPRGKIITCASDFYFAGIVYVKIYDLNRPDQPKELFSTFTESSPFKNEIDDLTCEYNKNDNSLLVKTKIRNTNGSPSTPSYQYLYQLDTDQTTVIKP